MSTTDAAAKNVAITLLVAAVPSAVSAATVIAVGTVRTGSVWSVTVIVAVTAIASLPAASTDVKVITLGPNIRVEPALFSTVTLLSTLSDTFTSAKNATTAESVIGVPEASTAATVIESGAVIAGPVTSLLISCVAEVSSEPTLAFAVTVIVPSSKVLASIPDADQTASSQTVDALETDPDPILSSTTTATPSRLQVPDTA